MRKSSGKLLIAASAAAIGMVLSAGTAEATTCSNGDYTIAATVTNAGITYDVLAGVAPNELWSTAESCAVSLGGTLVSIESSAQNTEVTDLIEDDLTDHVAWIGLEGPNGFSAADYYWVNGAPMNYENWEGGFPTDISADGPGETTYGYMGGSGLWANANDDTFTSEDIGAIVVVPTVTSAPEPASVAILGAALFGLGYLGFIRRRKKSA